MADFTCEYCERSDRGQSAEFPRACLTCERHCRDAATMQWVTVVETYDVALNEETTDGRHLNHRALRR